MAWQPLPTRRPLSPPPNPRAVIVWVQENVSWGVGFAIPAACMGLAVLTFLAGSPQYTHVSPTERCAPLFFWWWQWGVCVCGEWEGGPFS